MLESTPVEEAGAAGVMVVVLVSHCDHLKQHLCEEFQQSEAKSCRSWPVGSGLGSHWDRREWDKAWHKDGNQMKSRYFANVSLMDLHLSHESK